MMSPDPREDVPRHKMADEPAQVASAENKLPLTPIENARRQKVCRFYAKKGNCRFGEKCRFVHKEIISKEDDKSERSSCPSTAESLPTASEGETQPGSSDKHECATTVNDAPKKRLRKRCRFFFSRSGCKRNDLCEFSHEKKLPQQNIQEESTIQPESFENKKVEGDFRKDGTGKKRNEVEQDKRSRPVVQKPALTSQKLSTLDVLEAKRLRIQELNHVCQRFGQNELRVVEEEGTAFHIDFHPSDPDWPFDVEAVSLVVKFPNDYPKVLFEVSVFDKQDLPSPLISYINGELEKWLGDQRKAREKKDNVNLLFRPFLLWFDRHLEELFIDAGKQMRAEEEEKNKCPCSEGHAEPAQHTEHVNKPQHNPRQGNSTRKERNQERRELVLGDFLAVSNKQQKKKVSKAKHNQLADRLTMEQTSKVQYVLAADGTMETRYNLPSQYRPSMLWSEEDEYQHQQSTGALPQESLRSDSGQESDDDKQQGDEPARDQFKRQGTEIRFKALELTENTSTIAATALALTMECEKCKVKVDVKVDRAKPILTRCSRCTNIQALAFRPTIIHQYSSTLGFLDTDGWQPFDLMLSETGLLVGCLNCSKENVIKDIHYGANSGWCKKCHQKLFFKVESAKFLKLQPAVDLLPEAAKQALMVEKPKRQPKTPGLKEGFPLPENGTCKHYKKSYRWLRFPCCGKCYPCDVCHEESENHEMVFASRMVCGYCSKEQFFSQNPCVACKSSMTRAKSAHWEGGKGCRDKTVMDRGDEKKYKNLTKTTSRKAENKNPKTKNKK